MGLFIIVAKAIPMYIWGRDILFDASLHLTFAFWILYILWFFVDQNKSIQFPFFLIAILVLFIISIQRILVHAHNDIGLLLGLIISLVSIGIVERKRIKGMFEF